MPKMGEKKDKGLKIEQIDQNRKKTPSIPYPNSEEVEGYERYARLIQWPWAFSSIDAYSFKGDETALDVGCATGKITTYLSKKCAHVVGLDVSDSMIEWAKQHYPPEEHPHLEFRCGSILEFDEQETYDIVTTFNCLHWLQNQQETALRSIFSALKPGGKALIVQPGHWTSSLFRLAVQNLFLLPKWSRYLGDPFSNKRYMAKEYQVLMEQTGFQECLVKTQLTEIVFKSRGELKGWLQTNMSFVKLIPLALRNQFAEELVTCFTQVFPVDPQGRIHYLSPKLEAHGLKPEVA